MSKLKVLFYLEPVDYSDEPLRLDGWRYFFSAFAQRSLGAFDSVLAASHALVAHAGSDFSESVAINQTAILSAVDFDRRRYSRDLCTPSPPPNDGLTSTLVEIRQRFAPDIVVSASENQYLKQVFGPDRVVFTELGPLPRLGMKPSIYLDPFGHQIGSAFDHFAVQTWPNDALHGFSEVWETLWCAPTREAGEENGLADWFRAVVRDQPAVLAVLQPADWITYEGVGPQVDPVSLLRKIAAEAPAGWMVVPQWHPSDRIPSEMLLAELSKDQPNILTLPEGLRIGHSEEAIHHVAGVVTISSNVSALAAIQGLPAKVLGRSKFASLSGDLSAPAKARTDLLAFLACRYCSPLEDWMGREGAFADALLRLHADPNSLFDPRGLDPVRLEAFRAT